MKLKRLWKAAKTAAPIVLPVAASLIAMLKARKEQKAETFSGPGLPPPPAPPPPPPPTFDPEG